MYFRRPCHESPRTWNRVKSCRAAVLVMSFFFISASGRWPYPASAQAPGLQIQPPPECVRKESGANVGTVVLPPNTRVTFDCMGRVQLLTVTAVNSGSEPVTVSLGAADFDGTLFMFADEGRTFAYVEVRGGCIPTGEDFDPVSCRVSPAMCSTFPDESNKVRCFAMPGMYVSFAVALLPAPAEEAPCSPEQQPEAWRAARQE